MSKFKVGDRVMVIGTISGTVIDVKSNGVVVECDEPSKGVEICQYPNKMVLWPNESQVELIAPNRYELHITCNDGKTTNAVYKVNGKIEKRTQAICNPSDTFSFNVGAELAINRVLYGTDYNPKDVAFKSTPCVAPTEDKPKFKVGDKVTMFAENLPEGTSRNRAKYVGEHGRITKVWSATTYRAQAYNTDFCCGYVVYEDELEPYAEPEQPKEPIKLYCVKEYHAGAWLTKGKTYVANKNSSGERYSLTFDDGWTDKTFSLERTTIGMGVVIGNYLIPLVKRPAKKDEIIFIEKCSSNKCFEGALCRVLRSDCGLPWVKTISGIYADTETTVSAEYLVLDGYTPEPEKEPEPVYYSGKIVCTESNENWWIAGKPYEVVDGVVFDETKCARKCVLSVEDLNSTTLFTAKFIPYLGEA